MTETARWQQPHPAARLAHPASTLAAAAALAAVLAAILTAVDPGPDTDTFPSWRRPKLPAAPSRRRLQRRGGRPRRQQLDGEGEAAPRSERGGGGTEEGRQVACGGSRYLIECTLGGDRAERSPLVRRPHIVITPWAAVSGKGKASRVYVGVVAGVMPRVVFAVGIGARTRSVG